MHALILLLLAHPAQAEPRHPLLDALQPELERAAADLALPDSASPHHLAYRVHDFSHLSMRAELGALVRSTAEHRRELGVDMRVGTPQRDSANYDDSYKGDGFDLAALPLGDRPLPLQRATWLLTDGAYKDAVENLARQEAALRRAARPEDTPDWSTGQVVVDLQPGEAPVDPAPWEDRVRQLSAVLLDHPQVEWSAVLLASSLGQELLLDSDGARVSQPLGETTLRVEARVRAEDGARAWDMREWIVRRPEQLPDELSLAATVQAMAEELATWRERDAAHSEYIGPVLIEAEAAALLVEQVLVPALEGTPPEGTPPKGSRLITFGDEGGRSAARLKRRALPPGWSVRDDPQAAPELPSAYRYDAEGQPGQAITLVDDGIIRTHFMSRTPSEALEGSNGHARGDLGRLPRGSASQLVVKPDRHSSARRLHRQALSLARAYGADHYVVIRRFQHPRAGNADLSRGFSIKDMVFGDGGSGGHLPVLDAVQVYADGHEEPVRGWQLEGLQLSLFREVVAAGPSATVSTWHEIANGAGRTPVTITVPGLLLGEAELAPAQGGGVRPPRLESPLAEAR